MFVTRSISIGGAALLRRNKSIHYADIDEEDGMLRTTSINHVYKSNFLLKFTANLENVIRNDIKEDQSKSEIILRSLSRHNS